MMPYILLSVLSGQAREYQVIDIIGDSISAGGNPEEPVGWVDIITGQTDATTDDVFDLWPDVEVNNCAVGGACASEWAANRKGMLSRVIEHEPDLVILYIGGNDFLWGYASDGIITKSEYLTYYDDLSEIIGTLQDSTSAPDIMLVNYYDLFDGYSENLPDEYGHYRTMSGVTMLANEVIAYVADERDCYLVDGVYDAFLGHCYGRYLDGEDHLYPETYMDEPAPDYLDIHPLTDGHDAISSEIFSVLAFLKATDYDDPDPDESDAADETDIADTPEPQTQETVSQETDSALDTEPVNTPTEKTTNPSTRASATTMRRGLQQEQVSPASFPLPTSRRQTSARLAILSKQNKKHQDGTTPVNTSVTASFYPQQSTLKARKAVISDKKTQKSAFSGQKPHKMRFLASQTPYYVHYTSDNDPIIIMTDNGPSDPVFSGIHALKRPSASKNMGKTTFSAYFLAGKWMFGTFLCYFSNYVARNIT